MIKQVSVIGCGWLGFPLGIALVNKGITVKGSTTSNEKLKRLRSNNIFPFAIKLTEDRILGDINSFLEHSDLLIINVPPGLRKHPNKNHIAEISQLIESIIKNQIQKVIYIGSTSVFKDESNIPIIGSNFKPNNYEIAKQLIEIENLLMSNSYFKTTIIRFGGLIDENRHPGNFLSGRSGVKNPKAPINLIHKEDCIDIIAQIIEKQIFDTVINAVYPAHPTRKSYYTSYSKDNNLPPPKFENTATSKGKIVESEKLVQLLSYKFKHAL
ncbi:Rossmann-fold NAD(P)-binding domain-containing protein [Winogradskyella vincentii]|uniref:Nucleoside-diphosphate-sugar epimerase n=1 Tax=Winogradskyella vincentii TaxID=2877122 RepID=A0ABS7XX90_9FLAO|nr:hypothetical protein [Winogradskyella vincentii]MCA0152272.1 hypothetical protein [Winogradskyella vincentii]